MADTATGARIVDRVLSPATVLSALGRPVWVRTLDPTDIPDGYRAAALDLVSRAAADLGMNPASIGVTFFTRCAEGHPEAELEIRRHHHGLVPKGETEHMFLSAELAPTQLPETAAHEVRHLWQNRQGWPAFRTRPQIEHDAREFGLRWASGRSS